MIDREFMEAIARAIAFDHLRLEGVDPVELDTLIAHQPMWWEAMKSHAVAAIAAMDSYYNPPERSLDGASEKG